MMLRYFVLLCISILPQSLLSQVTLDASDFLDLLGNREVSLQDTRFSIPVNVGSPGANQTWDFRSQMVVDSLFSVSEFLSPAALPNADRFPSANFVEKITSPTEPGFANFDFLSVGAGYFIDWGDSSVISSSGFDTTLVHFQNDTLAPLPIAFGNTWLTTERDTTGLFPQSANISIDTTLNTIDGWGTVRIPLGDFNCLRLRQEVQVINQTIVNGSLFSTSVDSFLQYNWVGPGAFGFVVVQSQFGETDPNFTDAQSFGRLDSLTAVPPTSVSETPQVQPATFALAQNYPNPFNPETVISFNLSQSEAVKLVVFNLLGQAVRVLANESLEAGSHQVRWNGTDDSGQLVSSGIYVYRLTTSSSSESRKMIFLQ